MITASPKTAFTIRSLNASDRADVLALARPLVDAADTYAFDPQISDAALWSYWVPQAPGCASMAAVPDNKSDNKLLGLYVIKPNHPGSASHIANASYVVASSAQGLGIGRQMGLHSLTHAKNMGYAAMQFNIVLASNQVAVKLWQSLGFQIRGTIPQGFRHKDNTLDDFHIMYRSLDDVLGG